MIEVEVHSCLREFLRSNGDRNFPHHLTMARLIARALRLGSPALLQTGSSVSKYCLSYLMPILLADRSVIIVAPPATLEYLFIEEIPRLQHWLKTNKQVRMGNRWQKGDRLLLTSPESWLSDRLSEKNDFPNIPTIIERADRLEEWTRKLLTISIDGSDWEKLSGAIPSHKELIRNARVKLTKSVFARPENPYGNYALLNSDLEIISHLCQVLAREKLLRGKFKQFWQQLTQTTISWISRDRHRGLFSINIAPGEIRSKLKPIWSKQTVVIIGGFLDIDKNAAIYRQQLGLDNEMLSLKFAPNRQNNHLRLYIPERFPLPNTPDFRSALLEQCLLLVSLSRGIPKPIVVIADDVPLQGQVGSTLAAEFGSRVRVEQTAIDHSSILICGWSFWQQYQEILPIPQLVIIATLPIPSLENPLVANRVADYKRRRQDWFRMYLLPTALKTLEQTVVPLRESQSIIALLDNRVNSRSYGKAILSTLEPSARINYLDPTWFGYLDS